MGLADQPGGLRCARRRHDRRDRREAKKARALGWILVYAYLSRRLLVGGPELTPTQARESARKTLAAVSLGRDPQAEKQAKRLEAAQTFRSMAREYLGAKQSELRPVSFRIAELYLTNPSYFGALHAMSIGAITYADINTCLARIIRNHSSHTAAAARRALSTIFSWAMMEGHLAINPIVRTRKPAEAEPRDRVLTDAELVAIWNACSGDADIDHMIRLLFLLGSRRSEVGGMAWSEFDLKAGTWRLPPERSKNGKAHTIVLPKSALEILASIPRSEERDHLFGARDVGFTAWGYAKAELDRRLGDKVRPWKIHDVRRTVATGMANIGIEPHIIEAVLNHVSGHKSGVAGVYNRARYAPEVRDALAKWSEHLSAIVA